MITINLGKSFLRTPKPYDPTGNAESIKRINTSDIVKDYFRLGYFRIDKCRKIINTLFDLMIEAIERKENINIDEFGMFRVYRYMGLSPSYTVLFRPAERLRAHFNPSHEEYLNKAILKRRYRKKDLLDFSPLAESLKEQRPQFVKEKKKKRTTVKAIDIDIKKIVAKLEDINERKYSADWRRKYRSEDR